MREELKAELVAYSVPSQLVALVADADGDEKLVTGSVTKDYVSATLPGRQAAVYATKSRIDIALPPDVTLAYRDTYGFETGDRNTETWYLRVFPTHLRTPAARHAALDALRDSLLHTAGVHVPTPLPTDVPTPVMPAAAASAICPVHQIVLPASGVCDDCA